MLYSGLSYNYYTAFEDYSYILQVITNLNGRI